MPGAADIDSVTQSWAAYEQLDDVSPTFEKSYEWLLANRPTRTATTIVHGDLRLGNVIVDDHGLAAAIDWELVHVGDPLEDLAWLCVKAWRFGAPLEVGGVGTIDELVAAYEAAGGRTVDRDALHWWLVAKTLWWGVGCMGQAAAHLSGAVRSHELAAIGRRVAEQEWDLIELLAPDEWEAARDGAVARAPSRCRGTLRTPDRARDPRRGAALPHRRRHARDERPAVVPRARRREHARDRRARACATGRGLPATPRSPTR